MPVLGDSAYVNCETVLQRARGILNDASIPGGDILTDSYPGSFFLLNAAYEHVQAELAARGVETYKNYAWLMALPVMPIVDPEGRLIITDQGTSIIYPNGVGNATYNPLTIPPGPVLPSDLVVPFKLWERQTGSQNYRSEMKASNGGLLNLVQQLFLVDWEWGSYQSSDALMFRGAQQSQDIKLQYEKQLPQLAAVTDSVPIRGVTNAAAYAVAEMFAAGRGSELADGYAKKGNEEMNLIADANSRKRQRIRQRRIPYSGRGFRTGFQTW
jgi:hypothetical protein